MRVKYLRGNRNTEYTIVISEDKSVSDLSALIQKAIGHLGDLEVVRREDLTNRTDRLSKEIIKKIEEQGAYLLKTIIRINEIEPGTPR